MNVRKVFSRAYLSIFLSMSCGACGILVSKDFTKLLHSLIYQLSIFTYQCRHLIYFISIPLVCRWLGAIYVLAGTMVFIKKFNIRLSKAVGLSLILSGALCGSYVAILDAISNTISSSNYDVETHILVIGLAIPASYLAVPGSVYALERTNFREGGLEKEVLALIYALPILCAILFPLGIGSLVLAEIFKVLFKAFGSFF